MVELQKATCSSAAQSSMKIDQLRWKPFYSSIWCNSCFFFFVGITCFWYSIITTPFFHWFPTFLQKKNRMIFGWWIYIYLVRICSKLVGTLRHYLLPKHTFRDVRPKLVLAKLEKKVKLFRQQLMYDYLDSVTIHGSSKWPGFRLNKE